MGSVYRIAWMKYRIHIRIRYYDCQLRNNRFIIRHHVHPRETAPEQSGAAMGLILGYFRLLAAKRPRSVLTNRLALPFLAISRIIAA